MARLSRIESQALTRRRLIEATETLVVELGYRGTAIARICERAGFTRGAFYANFTTKEDLLVAVLARQRTAEATALREILEGQVPLITGLRAWAQRRDPGAFRWAVFISEVRLEALRNNAVRHELASHDRERRRLIESIVEARRTGPDRLRLSSKEVASVIMALDVDLDIQHLVDPDEVQPSVMTDRVLPALLGSAGVAYDPEPADPEAGRPSRSGHVRSGVREKSH